VAERAGAASYLARTFCVPPDERVVGERETSSEVISPTHNNVAFDIGLHGSERGRTQQIYVSEAGTSVGVFMPKTIATPTH